MLATILAVIAIVIIAVLAIAATRPDSFRLQRSATIKAPPDRIHALINDFHSWGAWSPWEKIDPALKRTFSGPRNGQGAVYEWEGNNKVGSGRMEILESAPGRIAIKLDFIKPMEGHNTAEFTLVPQGDSTEVTWAMHGPVPYVGKIFQMFVSMEKMVGGQFETGLANRKAAAEGAAAK